MALLVAILIVIFAPQAKDIIAAITRPLLAAVGSGVAVLALVATWRVMRRAAVR